MTKAPGINYKSSKRHFIHDHELKEMESNDKQKPIEQYSNNNSQINYNLKRLDIAKELLIAQFSNATLIPKYATICNMIDDAIRATDLFLERINQ